MIDAPTESLKHKLYRRAPLLLLAGVALALGVVARFKGLGKWPFAVDEYYLGRSIENLLRFGVPAYECGGYYVRGILVQYLAAGLRLVDFSPELAPRVVAAVSSLVALPAAYLLGARAHSRLVGVLAVTLLAVSAWEVEIARFGRMYAPFQAVFVWYLVFFLRYTIDRHTKALWGMVTLSIVGALVWEGGVFLGLANLLPPFINHARGRLTTRQLLYIGAMALLVPPLYWAASNGLRYAGDIPALPPDYAQVTAAVADGADGPYALWSTLALHRVWMALAVPVLALAGWTSRWILGFRERWLAAFGLLVVLAAALAHQFLLSFALLVLLLLARLVEWRELTRRAALPFFATVASAAVFWAAFALSTESWRAGAQLSGSALLVALGYQFFDFPDLLEVVARPWARAAPGLSLTLLGLLAFSTVLSIVERRANRSTETALLMITAVLLLLVGISDPPQDETRYVFFLYPVVFVLAITALFHLVDIVGKRQRSAAMWAAAITLGGFALTEDFRPNHLLHIDSRDANFRRDIPAKQRNHYIGRGDVRAVADWLKANVNPSTDLVISGQGVASLEFYYPYFDFVFVDPSDQRLAAWACRHGTVDRWSNLPLVYSVHELRGRIAASPRTYLVVDPRLVDSVLPDLEDLNPQIVRSNDLGGEAILFFESPAKTVP